MIFANTLTFSKRKKSDLLVVPFWQGKKGAEIAFKDLGKLMAYVSEPIKSGDFRGKSGESLIVYLSGQPEKRLMLLGLGQEKEVSVESLRTAYAQIVKRCRLLTIKAVNLCFPQVAALSDAECGRGISEGVLMSNYSFVQLKHRSLKEEPHTLLTHVTFVLGTKESLSAAKKALTICKGVYLTRDLVNGNADEVNPDHLVSVAKTFAKQFNSVKTTIFNKKKIESEKMGLLLAVGRGSSVDPALIIVEYRGKPSSKEHTVLVGKGVTYDTGGLNLKKTGYMETMKQDMAGAGTVFGILYAVASLGLELNLSVVVPTTENSIGPRSYKPGDVYQAYDGKTVEIGNTDAEGRLILADALAYAVKNLKPTRIIDFATLTGAIEIALGQEAIGLMSNHVPLEKQLMAAGEDTFERAHPLPMFSEYREQLKSEIADIKNVGGRGGSSITAAKFLEEFVGKVPWAHFDIAAIAFFDRPKRYYPPHASGMGVRLGVSFLEGLVNSHEHE